MIDKEHTENVISLAYDLYLSLSAGPPRALDAPTPEVPTDFRRAFVASLAALEMSSLKRPST